MQVKCTICGAVAPVEKWQEEYDKVREHQQEPYICDPCQERIRHDAQRDQR
jgi:uncharacterized protein YlaI